MCVHTSTAFTFTCPETGITINGTYDDTTGRMNLEPDPDATASTRARADCIFWCIRCESSAFLSWGEARHRLVRRGADLAELWTTTGPTP